MTSYSRQTIWLSGLAMVVILLGGLLVTTVILDSGPAKATQAQLQEEPGAKPVSIPGPNQGVAPKTPGERGGWEQLTVFGLMLGAMLGIGVVVFRGGKKARAGKAQWMAAGESGHDGALLAFDHLAPADATPADGAHLSPT